MREIVRRQTVGRGRGFRGTLRLVLEMNGV